MATVHSIRRSSGKGARRAARMLSADVEAQPAIAGCYFCSASYGLSIENRGTTDDHSFFVKCSNCEAQGPAHAEAIDAANEWNQLSRDLSIASPPNTAVDESLFGMIEKILDELLEVSYGLDALKSLEDRIDRELNEGELPVPSHRFARELSPLIHCARTQLQSAKNDIELISSDAHRLASSGKRSKQ